MAKEEDLLRSKDAAHILDCSPDDVIVLAKKGLLKASKPGRYWRFKFSDVIAYRKKLDRAAKKELAKKQKKK